MILIFATVSGNGGVVDVKPTPLYRVNLSYFSAGLIMNFAALMAIVVWKKGYLRHGGLQLLSVFILTPAFLVIEILVAVA
ncbi:hypothetical protein SAMN05660330_03804 [Desulforhopalus singaporensis]|uniref:Uncharacterized protein n=1 Tax=Desulforhopalus singaporensis TaxID=91360 RepID=A0A1H0V1B7_9BACT|nr:hypothetical protein SAMN05660330_03804 [Desulforhopalus singaporensis]